MTQSVRVTNTSRETVVAEYVELATSFFARLKGLLGRRGLSAGHGMLIRPTESIHTFFMAFPIDVIFLDGSGHVLHTIPDMGPNRVSPFFRNGRSVIELPAGTIVRSRTQPGDQIDVG